MTQATMEVIHVDATEIEKERGQYVTRAQEMLVIDDDSYKQAGEHLRQIKAFRAQVDSTFDPTIQAAHKQHKDLLALKKKFSEPLDRAENALKAKAITYHQEQERKRQEEIRRQEEERRRQEEEQRKAEEARIAAERKRLEEERIKEAEQLENEGHTELAEVVLSSPVEIAPKAPEPYIPPAPAPAAPARVEGLSYRDNWKCEVTDLFLLVKAVAAGQVSLGCLEANTKALNQMARALKHQMQVPGVRVYNDKVANVR